MTDGRSNATQAYAPLGAAHAVALAKGKNGSAVNRPPAENDRFLLPHTCVTFKINNFGLDLDRISYDIIIVLGLFLGGYWIVSNSSLAIANEFLTRASNEGRNLTHMQLQKLVYISHGWSLAVTGEELVGDVFEAWEFGPVSRRLYDALKHCRNRPVKLRIKWGDDTPFPQDDGDIAVADLVGEQVAVIDNVWENFKDLKAFQLSALTHKEGSPWMQTFISGENRPIANNDIQEHFIKLADSPD